MLNIMLNSIYEVYRIPFTVHYVRFSYQSNGIFLLGNTPEYFITSIQSYSSSLHSQAKFSIGLSLVNQTQMTS